MAPTRKEIDYLFSQTRRLAAHREQDAEKAIRKLYKELLSDVQTFLGAEYAELAQDDALTYAILQQKGEYSRFLEEVERHIDGIHPLVRQEIRHTVEETYSLAYQGMVDAVKKSADSAQLKIKLEGLRGTTAEVIKRAVENPVSGLTLNDTLEKHRKDVIYEIKKQIGVGLTQGDRYSTMARRLSDQLNMNYRKAIRIVRTETHRVREQGAQDGAAEIQEKLKDADSEYRLVKIWRTMSDERVRPQQRRKTKKGWKTYYRKNGPNHMKMEGQTVLVDEYFDLGSGVKALCPGSSGVAGHDINCRCYAREKLMNDAEFFAATGRHFPGYKAPEGIENSENTGIINKEIYPDELAGVKRGEPMTFEQADELRANPNFQKGGGYTINCQSCVVSYEARRRGFDVETLPNTRGSMLSQLARDTSLAWIDPSTGAHPDYIVDKSKIFTAKSYKKYLDSVIERGNRYTLQFGWKGRGNSGHIIHVDRLDDGTLRLYDPQIGRSYTGGEIDTYLTRLKYSGTVYGTKYPRTPKILRVDNLQIDDVVARQIMKGSGT